MNKIGKNAKVYFIGMLIGGIALGVSTVVADTIINSTNVSYKTSTVKAALDDLYGLTADDIWKKIYPVGAVYISVNSTSPATLFGGTWQAFGTGRTLVGIDTSDDDFKTVEKTGGEKTHTLTRAELPNYELGHTVGYVPIEHSRYANGSITNWGGSGSLDGLNSVISSCQSHSDRVYGWTIRSGGENTSHNNMAPYVTVYMWKRTA